MRTDLFQHEVTQTSAIFGRKNDVKVVFRGDQAMTDGSTIILPAMAQGKEVSDEAMRVMRGYTDHEAGHVRHSDMEFIKEFNLACVSKGNHLLRSLANALEDIWLEKRVRAEYPGAEANIKATADAVNREFLGRLEKGEVDREKLADMAAFGPVAITWEGRRDYVGASCDECLEVLPESFRGKLPGWVARIDDCENSVDVCALAQEIEKEIRDGDIEGRGDEGARDTGREPEEHDEESGGDGDSESGGEDDKRTESEADGDDGDERSEAPDGASGGADDAGDVDGDGERSDEGAEGSDADDGDDGDGGRDGDGEDAGHAGSGDARDARRGGGKAEADRVKEAVTSPGAYDEVYELTLEDVVKKTMEDDGVGGGSDRDYLVYTTEDDHAHHRSDLSTEVGQRLAACEASKYDRKLAKMQGEVNALRRQLERMLMAQMNRDWDYGREDGRLDARRFTAAVAGRPNVFKQRMPRKELDTALTILVDLSGSMCSGRPKSRGAVAGECAMALVEAVDRTGIAYEVLGFSNIYEVMGKMDACKSSVPYTRVQSLDLHVFKAFEERLFEAKGPIASIANFVGGDNTDGEFVMMAAQRLMQRPERRRVMLTLSDGSPCARSAGASRMAYDRHLRQVVKDLQEWDFDLAAIGIQTDEVSKYYPVWTQVDRLEDLAKTGLGVLSDLLLGQRRNAA